jgi:hypothetical protein
VAHPPDHDGAIAGDPIPRFPELILRATWCKLKWAQWGVSTGLCPQLPAMEFLGHGCGEFTAGCNDVEQYRSLLS